MRIVTINTGKGDGAYRRRVELLTEGLRALRRMWRAWRWWHGWRSSRSAWCT
jgi:hypothetical protein